MLWCVMLAHYWISDTTTRRHIISQHGNKANSENNTLFQVFDFDIRNSDDLAKSFVDGTALLSPMTPMTPGASAFRHLSSSRESTTSSTSSFDFSSLPLLSPSLSAISVNTPIAGSPALTNGLQFDFDSLKQGTTGVSGVVQHVCPHRD